MDEDTEESARATLLLVSQAHVQETSTGRAVSILPAESSPKPYVEQIARAISSASRRVDLSAERSQVLMTSTHK
eukprot:6381976-Prymnesium_polylepis.2